MTTRRPAEIFPPSEFIREEMEARGWTVADMAYHAVIPLKEMQALLDGARLTAHYAERLAVAFGTSALFWSNLWMAWKKWSQAK